MLDSQAPRKPQGPSSPDNDTSPAPRPSANARQRWREARRFQEKAQLLLDYHATAFPEWLLLETLREVLDETEAGATQAELARRSGLSQRVVSYWMALLVDLGLVDRAPDEDGHAWCVLLTELGDERLEGCNERLAAAGLTG